MGHEVTCLSRLPGDNPCDCGRRWETEDTQADPTVERHYHTRDGADFHGRVVKTHRNSDDAPNGIVRVEITDPGTTRYRTGERVDVGTAAEVTDRTDQLTPAEALAYLTKDPGRVPCSRYGRDSEDCAPVAVAVLEIMAEANGDPITRESADYVMGLVVNDHDDPMELLRDHGTAEQRETIDEDVWWEYAPRSSLSSGGFSTDLQLADVVRSMPDTVRAAFDAAYPEWETLTWSGSWVDAEASGVDVEYTSWAVDWVESHTNVRWEDGEPYIQATDPYADQESLDVAEIRLTDDASDDEEPGR